MTDEPPLSVREARRRSLQLLSRRDRLLYTWAVIAQVATALLDLVGLLLIGAVTAVALAGASSGPVTATTSGLLARLGVQEPDQTAVIIALGSGTALVLITKTVVSTVVIRRTFTFLATRSARAATAMSKALLDEALPEIQRRASQRVAFALTSGADYAIVSVLGMCAVAIAEAALLLLLGLALLAYNPLVTVGVVLYFGAVGLVLQRVLGVWASEAGLNQARANIGSTITVQEALATYREINVLHRKELYVQRLSELRGAAARSVSDAAFIGQLPRQVLDAALVAGAALLIASQLSVRDRASALGTLAIFLAAASRILPSLLRLQGATTAVRNAAGAAEATYELANSYRWSADSPPELPPRDALSALVGREHPGFEPTLDVTGVTLTFEGATSPALRDVSLSLGAGRSLAIVGTTGAGKSTLADVLLGLLVPDRGSVRLGGLEPPEAVRRWPGALAYVPQAVSLRDGTVWENVALGLPRDLVADEHVWEALDRAHLGDMVRAEPDGLETRIGERGTRLSGGQRQRLGLARALYTRPRLLVLDEATSALDAETERAVTATLRELHGDVTTVTIAHRLATIRQSDLVIYLEQGAIVAAGSFEEVRRQASGFQQQVRLLDTEA